MDEMEYLVDALSPVAAALQRSGIRHFVGGSVASSFHGATRATMDVDLVCEMTEDRIEQLLESIGTDYYASETAIREAVRRKGCFNLIHLPTAFKVDLFVSRGRPFDIESMDRATTERLGVARFVELPIATAEDLIVSKLEWFRLTDETSQRQWDDVSRLLDLLGDDADGDYLRRAARSVEVGDLLERLIEGQ